MMTRQEHQMEQSALGAFTCPVCRRTIDKTEYWDVGYIRMKWLGDGRYDGEEGVFVHDGDVHPWVDERMVCQDCFESVMKAICERRENGAEYGTASDDALKWVRDSRKCLLEIDVDDDSIPKDVKEWIYSIHMSLTRLEVRMKEMSEKKEEQE